MHFDRDCIPQNSCPSHRTFLHKYCTNSYKSYTIRKAWWNWLLSWSCKKMIKVFASIRVVLKNGVSSVHGLHISQHIPYQQKFKKGKICMVMHSSRLIDTKYFCAAFAWWSAKITRQKSHKNILYHLCDCCVFPIAKHCTNKIKIICYDTCRLIWDVLLLPLQL